MFGKHFYFLISIKIAMMVFVALFGVVNYLHAVDLFYDGFSGGIHGQQPANWQNHGIDIYYSLTDGYAIVDAGNDLGYVSRTILEFDVDLYNELYVRVSDVFLGGGTFQIGVRRGSVEYLLGEETSPGLYFFDIPTRTGLHGTQTLNVVIRINAFGWPIEESIVVDFVVVQGDFTYTFTPTNTATCTPTLTPTNSSTPTSIPSITPSSTLTISPSMTPSLILTATRTAISTLTLTPTSLTTILPSPSRTASVTHTPFHSLTSTRTSTSFERSATTTQTAKKELFFYMEQNRVWAYPNPAKETVTFLWNDIRASAARIVVYQMNGEKAAVIQGDSLTGNTLTWQTGSCAPGIYLYQIILTLPEGTKKLEPGKIAISY